MTGYWQRGGMTVRADRSAVHIAIYDNAEGWQHILRPFCGARVSGDYQMCAAYVATDILECRNCMKKYAKHAKEEG